MLKPGEYADVLRAMGQTLDALSAQDVDIAEFEAKLVVSWVTARGERVQRDYDDKDVNALRIVAHDIRKGTGMWAGGQHAEWLRTIGQSMDRQGIALDRLSEQSEGFRLTGSANGRFISQTYAWDVLGRTSEQRRAERGAPRPEAGLPPARDNEHLTRRPRRPER